MNLSVFQNPAVAIPKGTLLALAISITSYLIMAVLSGTGALRDASGEIAHVGNTTLLASCKPNCKYGLHNSYKVSGTFGRVFRSVLFPYDITYFFGL